MNKHFPPTAHEYRAAVHLNSLLLAICAVAMLVMIVGLTFATSWIELIKWTVIAVVSVLAICAIAFLVGAYRGPDRG